MANEIRAVYKGSHPIYGIIQNATTGYAWNGSDFVAFDDDDIATYDIPLTDLGGNLYAADMPTIENGLTLRITIYAQLGGSPAVTDTMLQTNEYAWNGALTVSEESLAGSYATLADGAAFMLGYMKSDPWDAATDSQKQKALITATRYIDRLNFSGSKTLDTQTLQFPRDSYTEIPTDIVYACILAANALLDGVDPEYELENLQVTRNKYSNVESAYNRDYLPEHILAGIPSVEAWRYLKPYLRDSKTVELYRTS